MGAFEVMVTNARIADLIRENRSEDISDAISEGAYFHMQTFEQALIDLVLRGDVDSEIAANTATNRHDFLVALESAAKRQRAAQAEAEAEAEEPEVPGVVQLPSLPGEEEPLQLRVAGS